MPTQAQMYSRDIFGGTIRIGSTVLFAHQSKLLEGKVVEIDEVNGHVKIQRTTGEGKLPKEPTRDGNQVVVIEEVHARPNS